MTKDELIDLATECGFSVTHTSNMGIELYLSNPSDIAKLAEKIAEAEREACAKVIEAHQIPVGNSPAGEMACEWTYEALKEIRDAIRARGQQ